MRRAFERFVSSLNRRLPDNLASRYRPTRRTREKSKVPAPSIGYLNGESHWFNVNFDDSIHKFLARKSFATHQPDLRSGDLYVFSSSRVHETFNVFGKKRVTLATFMAWPSWEATGGEVLLYQ